MRTVTVKVQYEAEITMKVDEGINIRDVIDQAQIDMTDTTTQADIESADFTVKSVDVEDSR